VAKSSGLSASALRSSREGDIDSRRAVLGRSSWFEFAVPCESGY
jgi:hypothetical protein